MEFSNGGWVSVGGRPGTSEAAEALTSAGNQAVWVILLIGAVAVLIRLGMGLLEGGSRRSKGTWRPEGSRRDGWRERQAPVVTVPSPLAMPEPRLRDKVDLASDQMRAVAENGFERTPLLNRSEARWLPVLDRAVKAAGQGHRVMAQVALNEVIRPVRGADEAALGAIVAKRLDFVVVDRRGMIALAVEYQGEGHWGEHAALRDAVKREALRKAGARLLEVWPDSTEDGVLRALAEALGPPPGGRTAETGLGASEADPGRGAGRSRGRSGERPMA